MLCDSMRRNWLRIKSRHLHLLLFLNKGHPLCLLEKWQLSLKVTCGHPRTDPEWKWDPSEQICHCTVTFMHKVPTFPQRAPEADKITSGNDTITDKACVRFCSNTRQQPKSFQGMHASLKQQTVALFSKIFLTHWHSLRYSVEINKGCQ